MYSNCIPPYHVPVRMRMIYLKFIPIIAHNTTYTTTQS